MKRVIRKCVFETNSSSSHSLTIKKVEGAPSPKVDSDVSFEIRSPLAKTVQLIGLADNAERDFCSLSMSIDEQDNIVLVKKEIIRAFSERFPEEMKNVTEEITSEQLCSIITPLLDSFESYEVDFFGRFDDHVMTMFYTIDGRNRMTVQKLKNAVIDELCRIQGWTKEQAMEEIDYEAFGYTEVRSILKDEATAIPNLKKVMEWDHDFKQAYDTSSKKGDLIGFAKQYVCDICEKYKSYSEGRIHCDHYFANGCLTDCDCGFENYYEIASKFDINYLSTDEEIRKVAEFYLSDECKITAVENYCGLIFEQSGDIY